MKRAVAILILLTMVLHCSSRLGFISYLYNQRHAIAFTVGLFDEIPIAICGDEYFADRAPLIIQDLNDTDSQLPVQSSQAREINLFIQGSSYCLTADPGLDIVHNNRPAPSFYLSPDLAVFHPPCEG